jgi:Na+-translocating ferredoxin:NAD+ oxidoreductase RnfG subunit
MSKILKNLTKRRFQILVIILIAICIKLQFSPPGSLFQKLSYTNANLSHIQSIFPDATNYEKEEKDSKWHPVYNDKQQTIGYYSNTSLTSKDFYGFAGPIPMVIGKNTNESIEGIALLEHGESPSYIEELNTKGLFQSWNNKSEVEAARLKVDTVSGATMSSSAVIKTMSSHLSSLQNLKSTATEISFSAVWKPLAAALVFLFSLFCYFKPKTFSRYRVLLLTLNCIVIGIICGYFLSMQILFNWSLKGIPFQAAPVFASTLLISMLIHLSTGKNFYCNFVCPFGSAQELLGKIPGTKKNPAGRAKKYLSLLRPSALLFIVLLLLYGVELPLTEMEPFSIFLFNSASGWMIGMASFFLIISIISPRFWCKYFCPTGQLNQFLCKNLDKETAQ